MDDSDDLDAIHIVAADKSYDDLDLGPYQGHHQSKASKGHHHHQQSSSEDQRASHQQQRQRSRHSRERKKRSGATSSGKTPTLQDFEAMFMREGYLDSSMEGALLANGMSVDEWQRHLAGTPGGGQYFMDLAGNIKRVRRSFNFRKVTALTESD